MAKRMLVLEEVLAIMEAVGIPPGPIAKVKAQAEEVIAHKQGQIREYDEVMIGSGFGRNSEVGFVEFIINGELTQMDIKKAREIGLMLLDAAEAAASDQMFVTLLKQQGLKDERVHGQILLMLREIRQGTRSVSWPS
jgi:hypothetical protein